MSEAALLAWDDAWSVGIPEIDHQHAELVALFAHLLDPAHRADHAFQRTALATLTEHVCRHFDDEERLMRTNDYPEFQRHAEVHALLLRQFNRFEVLLKAQPDGGPGPTILEFVGRWLLDHIQDDDKRLGDFLLERAGAVTAL